MMPDRRSLYGTLLTMLMVCAPHAAHLPVWVGALCLALSAWRALLAQRAQPLPPRWLLLALMTAMLGGILVTFHTLFSREASVTMLILLTALKQMEVRTVRDAEVTLFLCCFIMVTDFFYSQSMATALFMCAALLVLTTSWLSLRNGGRTLPAQLRAAAVMLAQAVPLMLVLFVLFPRVQGPLWGAAQDAYGTSGLDDRMEPGSLSKLTLSDAVAFRVAFDGAAPRHDRLYWRGPVLSDFDGRTWTPGEPMPAIAPRLDRLDEPVDYTVTLEPHNKNWLFALDMPTRTSIPAAMTYDFRTVRKEPVTARLRYSVHSELGYRANADESPRLLRRELDIPRALNPRAQRLAQDWRATLRDDEAVVRAALAHFSREDFHYTLEPPPLGPDGVDDFLFGTRRGFCEHYASSFTFLMRAAGIPARVVTGYQGGEYNDVSGYYIVRQSDAHAWAEVWLKGRGWTRVDPTAAIAPARVERSLAAAVPDGAALLPFMERTQSPWLQRLRLGMDALAYQWNQWVLGYNPERQMTLLARLGMERADWRNMTMLMTAVLAGLVGLSALAMLRRLRPYRADEAQRLYLAFCRKLEKAGIVRAAHEGPRDFAARAARMRPDLAAAIADISARYAGLRYAGRPEDAAALRGLRAGVRAFRL